MIEAIHEEEEQMGKLVIDQKDTINGANKHTEGQKSLANSNSAQQEISRIEGEEKSSKATTSHIENTKTAKDYREMKNDGSFVIITPETMDTLSEDEVKNNKVKKSKKERIKNLPLTEMNPKDNKAKTIQIANINSGQNMSSCQSCKGCAIF